jgi:hypothetical protein
MMSFSALPVTPSIPEEWRSAEPMDEPVLKFCIPPPTLFAKKRKTNEHGVSHLWTKSANDQSASQTLIEKQNKRPAELNRQAVCTVCGAWVTSA